MINNKKRIVQLCLFYRLEPLSYDDIVPIELVEDLYEGRKIQGYQRIVQYAFARVCSDLRVTEKEYNTLKKEIFANWYDWTTRQLEILE